jgi:3-hydroxyacyl-CoA dehydrogenase
MKIQNVTVAGGGTLGSQIAWQTAFHGFNVIVYDAFDQGLENSKSLHKQFADLFMNQRGATQKEIEDTFARLDYTTDLREAVKDADLISESVPENEEIKKSFYKNLSKVAPEKTLFTTNSSTTLPSNYAEVTGRPKKFCALHFANGIWDSNVGEVMGHPGTDKVVFDRVVEFAKEIGMVPIKIKKEQNGYVLNTLLVPLLNSALDLLVNEVSGIESIDKTWMISTKTPMGPGIIMDMVGMKTLYDINKLWGDKLNDKGFLSRAEYLKTNYVDKGNLGISSGEGFYKYPNPKFEDPNFLKE